MKTLLLLITGTLFSSALSAQTQTLHLGSHLQLPLKGHTQVWIEDRQTLSAEVVGGHIKIRGLKEGSSRLKVGPRNYTIQVVKMENADALLEVEKVISTRVGLRTRLAGGRLLIEGRLYRMEDWQKIASSLLETQANYIMKAEMNASLRAEAQSHFSKLISQAHLPPQTVIFDPEPEIRVAGSELSLDRYRQLLRPYGIQVHKDENSLDMTPTVKVQITVAEIKREAKLNYGLKWPEAYTASVLPDGTLLNQEMKFSLAALENNGHGKILASPNIICKSGKEAEFLAGGEFPIKIVNYEVHDIVWKRYGILLRVKPKADSSGRISLSIETEISTLDKSTAVDNIPGILTNRVSSHFDLSKPQTIALSGLLKNEEGRDSSGLPLLSRLPILGPLFSSKSFRDNKSELVIFVRPSILHEGESSAQQTHLGDGRDQI